MTDTAFKIPAKLRNKAIVQLQAQFNDEHCIQIEKGLYYFTKHYCGNNSSYDVIKIQIYNDCLQNILYNCNPQNKKMLQIKAAMLANTFNAYNLAFLRPEELDSDQWTKIINRLDTTEDKIKNAPCIEWRPCRSCKNTKHSYYQMQTRSADEPMTSFYTCKQCHKTTKINN